MENNKTIWEEYTEGLAYQNRLGLSTDLPEFERFKAGDQWPAITDKTKNLPRPVFNIVDMFIGRKRAGITNQTLLITYKPAEMPGESEPERELALQGAKDYTDYTKVLWQNMDQDELCNDFIDDAITGGTGILHYFWDDSVYGGQSRKYKGELRGEVIDPLDIFFGNPKTRDVQKQPYIIIRTIWTVGALKEYGKSLGLKPDSLDLISSDAVKENYGTGSEKDTVIVLTKYFRKHGEVYYTKATKGLTLIDSRPLTPGSNKVEDESDTEGSPDAFKIRLYPVVVMQYRKRKDSIFGVGECKELITINKAYNFLRAMQLLTAQSLGWPKTVIKRGGILNQTLTNEPGEIIWEESDRDSIRYLHPSSPSGGVTQIASEIFEMSRTVTGVTDVSTGEVIGANMAATAIIALQNQARTPIREYQKKYHRAIERCGNIWQEFYKAFYTTPRVVTVESPEGTETTEFTGAGYAGIEFALTVDVGTGSEYGEELSMATLDKFYDRKEITIDEYIELAPKNVVPFKEQLKKMLEEKKMREMELSMQQGMTGMQEQMPGMMGGVMDGMQGLR